MNYISIFAFVAGLCSIAAFIPYIRSILLSKTKPSGPSWWTWTVITMVIVVSSWFAGVPWPILLLPTWLCFSQLLVAVLSIRRGDNQWDFLNMVCIGISLCGVFLWLITGQPVIALVISIVSDFFASSPNIRHVWSHPEQENFLGWGLGWLSSFLELFTISHFVFIEYAWAAYFFINMSTTLILVSRPFVVRFLLRKTKNKLFIFF
jgi:hypothetical protein